MNQALPYNCTVHQVANLVQKFLSHIDNGRKDRMLYLAKLCCCCVVRAIWSSKRREQYVVGSLTAPGRPPGRGGPSPCTDQPIRTSLGFSHSVLLSVPPPVNFPRLVFTLRLFSKTLLLVFRIQPPSQAKLFFSHHAKLSSARNRFCSRESC